MIATTTTPTPTPIQSITLFYQHGLSIAI
ncbi:unnamed protein product, partial [Rotaria sp. Silwood2]